MVFYSFLSVFTIQNIHFSIILCEYLKKISVKLHSVCDSCVTSEWHLRLWFCIYEVWIHIFLTEQAWLLNRGSIADMAIGLKIRFCLFLKCCPCSLSGYYGNSGYADTHRMGSLIDQHVSVISSVTSTRSVPAYAEVHDPLNILNDMSRKPTVPYYPAQPPLITLSAGEKTKLS